ncbi:hypothetical protein BY996DRAFT_8534896 [Phakopsora pachyrhizi]|nr:hypothetical protein BY996DRAFT_8534896 [Phakopsora pachyrhizi]
MRNGQPEKRPKPFRETIPKEEDNSNSKGAKIADDKPARFDIDNNGANQNVQDLITVEDNEEYFVRVESKRYESEGSSSEETIGEVSEEEGGEERGNEGLVEGKLEEGNDGMIVVGFEKDRKFEPIVVTDPFVLTRYITPPSNLNWLLNLRYRDDQRDLITVEDNKEDFVRVESKRYESEGSSSEETIGEVSEEEGGEERGNEGLVEGKLEEGNDGMIVVGFEKDRKFEPIVVTDPFVLTRYITPPSNLNWLLNLRYRDDQRELITVEDNKEDFVRVESKRYESEGSSSEETIGEVSEEEGGEERGNEGLVEGKLEEGKDGMNVVGFEKDRKFEPIVVTDPFLLMGKDKYELMKRGGWKETMVTQIDDCDGNNGNQGGKTGWMMGLEASPLGQVWAGVLRGERLLMGKNKFESIREVLILVGQEPKKVLVLETFNKWRESSQVRDV